MISSEDLRWAINLLDDGSVATGDGEILGVWGFDENDHPHFTPHGHSEPLFSHCFVPFLCDMIREWHEKTAG